jgi:hypothetical protein
MDDVFCAQHPESPRLQAVPVRQRDFDSSEPYDLIQAVVDVVNALGSYGLYTIHELPPPVRQGFHVDYYLGQVMNGGHEQYFGNSRSAPGIHDDVHDGLSALEDQRYRHLFDEVYAYVTASVARQQAVEARAGFNHQVHGRVDSWIEAKDKEFYQLNGDDPARAGLIVLNNAFLRNSGAVQPTPNADWKYAMAQLIDANPLLERRLQKSGQQKKDFVADLIKAPLKRTYFQYAKELASRNGIELPAFPVENHTTHEDNQKLWWNIFKIDNGYAVIVFRDDREAILLTTDVDEAGTLKRPSSALDRLLMERAEV